jgi:hypothetical protein
MASRESLPLNYQEAVHIASFLRRIVSWDSTSLVRIQTRKNIVAFWAQTPMDCLAFIAVPLAEEITEPIDTTIYAARFRDIIGDVSKQTVENKSKAYSLSDEYPPTQGLRELPPTGAWIQGERMTCSSVSDVVDSAIAEYHRQSAAFPTADRALLDQLATQIWQGPGIAAFPLRGLHAARQLGFLSIPNARAEFSTLNGWKRFMTPAGQIFFNASPPRTKLRVV